jgi:predicted Zn-dependent protease
VDDILDEGIDCYPEEVYEILYEEGYDVTEEKLRMMLNEHDNGDNMLYPLDCFRDLSYDDWLEYKEMRDKKVEEAIKMRESKKLPTKKAPARKVARNK